MPSMSPEERHVSAFLRLFFILLGGLTLFAVAMLSARVPQPWGRIAALLTMAAGMLVWYRVDRPREVRAERRAKGHCLHCGYDLTGNVSGACPECGVRREAAE
jgi:hypothetical protein